MKRTITFGLGLVIAFCITMVNPLAAQNINKDMKALAKKYESAYNRKDAKVLKSMYTNDAVEINIDGTTISGNGAISDSMAVSFSHTNVTIKIITDKNVKESDGSITTTGTYQVTGGNDKGEKIDSEGAFNNTIIKEDGKWKIAKSVLTVL